MPLCTTDELRRSLQGTHQKILTTRIGKRRLLPMKSKLKSWVSKKLHNDRKLSGHPPEEKFEGLPLLPIPRASVLTPTPSTECLVLEQESAGLFFRGFPRELRWQILTLAFGSRAVHMDLSFVHPVAGWEPGDYPVKNHAGLLATTDGTFPPPLKWDTSEPKSWKWWGCVCHRPPPEHVKTYSDRLRGVDLGPAADYCRFGAPHSCEDWPGDYPLKCKIGAMGWLLSCRQA